MAIDCAPLFLYRTFFVRPETSLPKYYLRDHSFVCLADRYYVILDLLADKYLRVEKEPFEELSHCVCLPAPLSARLDKFENRPPTKESRLLLGALMSRGLISEHLDQANVGNAEPVIAAAHTLVDDFSRPSLVYAMRYVWFFLVSAKTAAGWLKQPISQTIDRVIERKRLWVRRSEQVNLEQVRHLISIFCRLRPFFNHRYLCLFDSLALLNFLAGFGIYPTWVFGVQSDPFAAHCWVQQNDILLNDTVDRVNVYTPLLAV